MCVTRTDIGLLESGRVVDTVTCDCHNLSLALAPLHDDQLLLGRGTGKDNLGVVAQDLVNLSRGHVTQISTVNDGSARLSVTENIEYQ